MCTQNTCIYVTKLPSTTCKDLEAWKNGNNTENLTRWELKYIWEATNMKKMNVQVHKTRSMMGQNPCEHKIGQQIKGNK